MCDLPDLARPRHLYCILELLDLVLLLLKELLKELDLHVPRLIVLLAVIDDLLKLVDLLLQLGGLLPQLSVLKELLGHPSHCGLEALSELGVVQLDGLQRLPHIRQQLDLPREIRE